MTDENRRFALEQALRIHGPDTDVALAAARRYLAFLSGVEQPTAAAVKLKRWTPERKEMLRARRSAGENIAAIVRDLNKLPGAAISYDQANSYAIVVLGLYSASSTPRAELSRRALVLAHERRAARRAQAAE